MESIETPDKITIKVKVAGEDYRDFLIDWSDHLVFRRQVFGQLASITGIPFHKIASLIIKGNEPHEHNLAYVHNIRQDSIAHLLDGLKRLNDGDSYAIRMAFRDYQPPFQVHLYLCNRLAFHDNQCTPWYCQHINGRVFLNRRIEIIKNGEPKYCDHYNGFLTSTLTSMNVAPYMDPICSFQLNLPNPYHRPIPPHYSRTHG